jgi:hypothetical protein
MASRSGWKAGVSIVSMLHLIVTAATKRRLAGFKQ